MHALPAGRTAARTQGAADTWNPTLAEVEALPHVMDIQEESSCLLRVLLAMLGGLNLRALTLHCCSYGAPGAPGAPPQKHELLTVERPCRPGMCLCCWPLDMRVYEHGAFGGGAPRALGSVREECSAGECARQCCCCVCTHRLWAGPPGARQTHRYSLRTGICCCGRVNNCCGATCCKPNLIMDVLTPDGKLASTVQMAYGGAPGCEGCARCAFDFNNYIVQFPEEASAEDRALLIAAVMSVEYALFSRQGGENS